MTLEQAVREVETTLREMAQGEFETVERCQVEARFLLGILAAADREVAHQ